MYSSLEKWRHKGKSMLPTPVDFTLDEIQSHFGTDEKARHLTNR